MRRLSQLCLMMALPSLTVHAAPYSQLEYFPLELQKPAIECQFGQRATKLPLLSDFEDKWFSKHLSAAEEPSLFEQSLRLPIDVVTSYRFIWLPSFHAPIMVRIDQRRDGTMILTAKRLTGQGGYDPGHIGSTTTRRLTAKESEDIRQMFAASDLIAFKTNPCDLGADGAVWLVETRVGGQYRIVKQWSPQNGPVRRTGMALLSLTGWKIGPLY